VTGDATSGAAATASGDPASSAFQTEDPAPPSAPGISPDRPVPPLFRLSSSTIPLQLLSARTARAIRHLLRPAWTVGCCSAGAAVRTTGQDRLSTTPCSLDILGGELEPL
jgi:hypothetical protein